MFFNTMSLFRVQILYHGCTTQLNLSEVQNNPSLRVLIWALLCSLIRRSGFEVLNEFLILLTMYFTLLQRFPISLFDRISGERGLDSYITACNRKPEVFLH